MSSFSTGKIKILKALKRTLLPEQSDETNISPFLLRSYTELRTKTELSNPVLSDYLKDLQKMDLIRRDIDTRKYYLTKESGEVALEILDVIESLSRILTSKDTRPLSKYKSAITKVSEIIGDIMARLGREEI